MAFGKHHRQSFLISTLITAAVIGGGVFWLVDSSRLSTIGTPAPTPINQDQAKLAVAYIKSLPAYDSEHQPDVRFVSRQEAPNDVTVWVYTSEDQRYSQVQVQTYRLEMQGIHVIHSQVSVSTVSGSLTVSSPEPGSIVSKPPLLIKAHVATPGPNNLMYGFSTTPLDKPALAKAAISDSGDAVVMLPVIPFSAPSLFLHLRFSDDELIIPISVDRTSYAAPRS
jgi:hypothetical protein